jgi:hypothetical protein
VSEISTHLSEPGSVVWLDRNTTVVFPAPLMSTIGELGSFLARESAAAKPSTVVGSVIPADESGVNGARPTPSAT